MGSGSFFKINENTFIQQGCIKLSKSYSKEFYTNTKNQIIAVLVMYRGFHKNAAQHLKWDSSPKSENYPMIYSSHQV